MFASGREFAVVGYEHAHDKRIYQLYRSQFLTQEKIKFISFLDDHIPTFLFMITENENDGKTMFKIVKLVKNKKV